jgi:hypothetical protein
MTSFTDEEIEELRQMINVLGVCIGGPEGYDENDPSSYWPLATAIVKWQGRLNENIQQA